MREYLRTFIDGEIVKNETMSIHSTDRVEVELLKLNTETHNYLHTGCSYRVQWGCNNEINGDYGDLKLITKTIYENAGDQFPRIRYVFQMK